MYLEKTHERMLLQIQSQIYMYIYIYFLVIYNVQNLERSKTFKLAKQVNKFHLTHMMKHYVMKNCFLKQK